MDTTIGSEFAAWMAALNAAALAKGYVGDPPFTYPDDWRGFYDDGFSPEEALYEDELAGM